MSGLAQVLRSCGKREQEEISKGDPSTGKCFIPPGKCPQAAAFPGIPNWSSEDAAVVTIKNSQRADESQEPKDKELAERAGPKILSCCRRPGRPAPGSRYPPGADGETACARWHSRDPAAVTDVMGQAGLGQDLEEENREDRHLSALHLVNTGSFMIRASFQSLSGHQY